jgi:hypothetical protein
LFEWEEREEQWSLSQSHASMLRCVHAFNITKGGKFTVVLNQCKKNLMALLQRFWNFKLRAKDGRLTMAVKWLCINAVTQ